MVRTRWKPNPQFRRKLSQVIQEVPRPVRRGVTLALKVNGEEAKKLIRGSAPREDGELVESVDWKYGPPPAGTLGAREDRTPDIPDDLRISIYAGGKKAPHAHLVHYGTGERVRKDGRSTGVMPPNAFFFPWIRALRRRMRNRIVRAARKALKEALK